MDSDIKFPLMKGKDAALLTLNYYVPKVVEDGISAGEVLVEAVIKYDGKPVARIPLVAKQSVEKSLSFSSAFLDPQSPIPNLFTN